jgi:hypothetical protein
MEKLPSSIEISKQLYLQIVNGEEVLEFQKYLNGDIEDKNLTKRYKIAFDMVKNDLMSRCKDGKIYHLNISADGDKLRYYWSDETP